MKKYIALLLPALLFGEDLKSILELLNKNNTLLQSSKLTNEAKQQNIKTKENATYPTIDVGGYYQNLQTPASGQAGDIYSVYGKIGYDLYDGDRKKSLIELAKNEYKISDISTNALKENLALDVTKDFFTIKNLKASLNAKEEAKKSINEQLTRVKRYVEAKLATKSDIDRLQSSFDTNHYEVETIKFQIDEALQNLSLKIGKKIDSVEDSIFYENLDEKLQENNHIKVLKARRDAILLNEQVVNSAILPQVKIENTYSRFGYNRTNSSHPAGADDQNNLTLSATMKLYDFGINKSEKQLLTIEAQALAKEIDYKTKEQEVQTKISLLKISTTKEKIKSAYSALTSAKSAFITINEKYNAGLVDYVTYLEALQTKTNANMSYEISKNELQFGYATYYYYNGKNLEEMLLLQIKKD